VGKLLNKYLEAKKETAAERRARWAAEEAAAKKPKSGKPAADLKKAVEMYTGKKIKSCLIVADPQVLGTYAINADGMHFLLTRYGLRKTYKDLVDNLEDVEFATWPPKSGSLQFGW
jgi:hypothetical protein